MAQQMSLAKLPTTEGWFRRLEDDRLEIFLKIRGVTGMPDRKIRASGRTQEMYELVDWFEQKTGLRVNVPDRQRTGPPPLAGQTTLAMGETADGWGGDDG